MVDTSMKLKAQALATAKHAHTLGGCVYLRYITAKPVLYKVTPKLLAYRVINDPTIQN